VRQSANMLHTVVGSVSLREVAGALETARMTHMTQDELWDTETAQRYDSPGTGMFAPEVLEPTVDRLVQLAGDGRVLELAIGTGRVAIPLAERGVPVVGIELSEAMITRLREKVESRCRLVGRPVLGRIDVARLGVPARGHLERRPLIQHSEDPTGSDHRVFSMAGGTSSEVATGVPSLTAEIV
jgi:SAM-dependent methyltransferase